MKDALAFLTVLPAGARARAPGKRALLAFPIVGLVVGGSWAVVAWGASHLWGPLPAAGLVLVADLLLTGGLHLDAFADVADGLASRRAPEEAIGIMRDPSVGAIGAAALVTLLLVRFSFLAILASHARWRAVVVPAVAGRCAMVWILARESRASEPSLASSLCASATLPLGVVAGLAGLAFGYVLAGTLGIIAVAGAGLVGETSARFFRARFGSVVGDMIGATGIVSELVALAVVSGRIG